MREINQKLLYTIADLSTKSSPRIAAVNKISCYMQFFCKQSIVEVLGDIEFEEEDVLTPEKRYKDEIDPP